MQAAVLKLKQSGSKSSANRAIAIKPGSSLLLGFSISCLSGVALAQLIDSVVELGRFEAYVVATTSVILFASGLKLVPTFHKGVIALASHRVTKFVLSEGCHWLLPMLYSVRPVAIRNEVVAFHDLVVTTYGEAGDITEFVDLKIQLSVQWQVVDPCKFLETEPEVMEKLLAKAITAAMRVSAFKDGCCYSSIVTSCGKSLTSRALPVAADNVESLGITVLDIFMSGVKRIDAAPGETQVFTKPAGERSTSRPGSDPWATHGFR